ncbi:hypothetical protein M3223_07695 [Paenibacillus pasadenensis]|uniref:hypothetical protein n=1 Tax=Paenibacillus pasadenensis TaxID=217090 RepID=UPI00203FA1A8|nr:hypothetical protein [Paenibacillus pasadenensis]MCM3747237.1 hypothetical protein [Paenibacillus pasadenensis]
MSNERAALSNFKSKGSNIGIILVLFILLVIVASLFCGYSIIRGTGEDQSITDSRRFDLENNTGYNLTLTDKNNEFERPGPPLNLVIPPNSSYNFEVQASPATPHTATATFTVTLPYIGFGSFDTSLYSATGSGGGSMF